MLVDRWGRQITYLRVSVTDRCNLRCVYCMPPEGIPLQSHHTILRYEEIAQVIRAAAEAGVREVRLTGGEPLARAGLSELVKMIADIPGIEDISLTTNAMLLGRLAAELKTAGLKRVNISLDTLRADRFTRITRGGSIDLLWEGIKAAEAVGLAPIKINTVAMRGVNEDELIDLARLSIDHPWDMRFIEIMPVKNQQTWGDGFPPPETSFISIQEIQSLLAPLHLEPVARKTGKGPAREFQIPGALGRVGFISPVSDHFCSECNRLRLTADGNLRPCLLSDLEVPVKDALQAGEPLLPLLQRAIELKPQEHELLKNHSPEIRCMMQIGG